MPDEPINKDFPTAPPGQLTAPTVAPPVLSTPPTSKPAAGSSSWRKLLSFVLSLTLILVLANAVASVLDDSGYLFTGHYLLATPSGILSLLTILATLLVYGLMGLTPAVPKRIVLPIVFLVALPVLAIFPTAIYSYQRLTLVDWIVSWIVVAACLGMMRGLMGSWKPRWPVVADKHLGTRSFSWGNLVAFVLLTLFVLLPAIGLYVGGCTSMAVSHFTDGFVSLRPSGVILQARKYVRDDGRTVVLFPMSHIAESDFYRSVEQSFTSNSVVLLEGVTDTNHLLTNHISYKRAAKALHLSEQHEDFNPVQGRLVAADVDVQEFTSNTIAMLNIVMLIHSEGINPHTISILAGFAPSPDVEQQLLEDLLVKRNQHVVKELFARLPDSNSFIIPWGAAHMAGIAKEIQKAGFHLVGTRDYVSIRFGSKKGGESSNTGWVSQSDQGK